MNIPKKLAVAAAIAMLGTLTLKTALAGEVTIYTALEDDEVADYMDAAKKAMPDVTFHVLRLSTGDMAARLRSEEHTSELQSLMRISYAVFCLKNKTKHQQNNQ